LKEYDLDTTTFPTLFYMIREAKVAKTFFNKDMRGAQNDHTEFIVRPSDRANDFAKIFRLLKRATMLERQLIKRRKENPAPGKRKKAKRRTALKRVLRRMKEAE